MYYTQTQWILLFFIYCVLGWIWESCYVSIRKRAWVNRGFLNGPWLPIYGTGAILILFTTLPVRENLLLTFLFGMVSATALEYVTGAAMEKLFHMRYWDYSGKPLNVKGHICLPVSLAWGGFSILLTELLHPPVERLATAIPASIGDKLGLLLTILFVIDVTRSVQDALDMKELLKKLADSNAAVKEFEARLEAAAEQFSRNSEQFRLRMREIEAAISEKREEAQQIREEKARTRKELLIQTLSQQRDKKSRLLSALLEKSRAALIEIDQRLPQAQSEEERARLERTRSSLMDMQAAIRKAEMEQIQRRNRDYQRAVSILERNPSAASRRYRGALAELKELRAANKRNKEVAQNRDQDTSKS